MLGCAAAIIVGVAAMVGALAIAVWSIDIDIDFAGVDADPGQGTESARIPVEVTPRTGLTDGTVVTVNSEAFRRSTVVGVAVCLAEADTEARGVDACDEVKGARYAVSSDGKLSATYPVPRVVTIGGVAHDCAASGTSCLVVAADASDYDHSGGQTISFRTDLGPTDLAISTSRPGSDQLAVIPPDAGAVAARSSVVVAASGFQPGEPVLMAHCAGFPQASIQACDPIDDSTAMAAIMFRTVDGATDLADDTGTVTYLRSSGLVRSTLRRRRRSRLHRSRGQVQFRDRGSRRHQEIGRGAVRDRTLMLALTLPQTKPSAIGTTRLQ